MAQANSVNELKKLIAQLQAERADHVKSIESIDKTFAELGIGGGAASAPKRRGPGRPPGSGTAKRGPGRPAKRSPGRPKGSKNKRTRGSFGISGDESVLQFVRSKGKTNSAEVNKHWASEGRKGKADNTLSRLVGAKKLKRTKIKGERGSRYEVA